MKKINKYMMATTAIHKMGDISSDSPDLCHVTEESETDYYGMWVLGMGFVEVKFPKETTRELTKEEIIYWNSKRVQINNQPSWALKVD